MLIVKLIVQNILHRPLQFLLGWLMLSVSVCIISVVLLVKQQAETQFLKNIDGVDMVLGAKGSPLQLILAAVYHADAPTGNIDFDEASQWMQHPFVQTAIPLAFGDSYGQAPIVGTTQAFLQKYNAGIQKGKTFHHNFELVAGATVAKQLGLAVGSQLYSVHGTKAQGKVHSHQAYTITGILAPTGLVIDKLLVGNLESVWGMHASDKHAGKNLPGMPSGQNHAAQEANTHHTQMQNEQQHQEITAVLLQFKNPMAQLQFPRMINSSTNMMAAVPAIEINRMFSLLGTGVATILYVGWGIMVLAGLSIFITLYNTLKQRKYEMALLRTLGGSRFTVAGLLVAEALLLCMAGFATGIVAARFGSYFLQQSASAAFNVSINNMAGITTADGWLLLFVLATALLAALIPAVVTFRLNISKTLTNG
jgi:putative ABC transport system permease protein